jgi:hypothetical protein
MLHKQIIPQSTDIRIAIPLEYVGRKLELLVYAVDEPIEMAQQTESRPAIESFKGILSPEQGAALLVLVQNTRDEWG